MIGHEYDYLFLLSVQYGSPNSSLCLGLIHLFFDGIPDIIIKPVAMAYYSVPRFMMSPSVPATIYGDTKGISLCPKS